MNIIITILILLLLTLSIVFVSYFFKKEGIFYLLPLLIIISYFLSFKITDFMGLNLVLSSITIGSIFIILYVFLEKGVKKDIQNIKNITILTSILTLLSIIIMNLYIAGVNDILSPNIKGLLFSNLKMSISFFGTLIISIYVATFLYDNFKSIKVNPIFSMILIYIIVCLFSVIINFIIGYVNILTLKEMLLLITSNFIFRIIILLINIPIILQLKNNRRIKL